jgi:putative flippase GtrA
MKRLVKFACVGAVCFAVQVTILREFEGRWPPVLANAVGFVVSAQLNFLLSSRITWRDVKRTTVSGRLATWLGFNANVLLVAGLNALLFALAHDVCGMPNMVATTIATGLSTIYTYLINHNVVFRPERSV